MPRCLGFLLKWSYAETSLFLASILGTDEVLARTNTGQFEVTEAIKGSKFMVCLDKYQLTSSSEPTIKVKSFTHLTYSFLAISLSSSSSSLLLFKFLYCIC